MNRDEAERCVDIAVSALKQGNVEKARRMLNKSLKMFPTERAESMLRAIDDAQNNNENNDETRNNEQSSSESSTRRRRMNEEPSNEQESSTPSPAQPEGEDDEDVVRVLKCSEDYYAVFNMDKSATTAEIKKQYRKLALKMHPDRNSSPHAEDAFKVLGRAYACLSNEEKRRIYDQHGVDPDVQSTRGPTNFNTRYRRAGPHTYTTFNFNNEDIDPDELFRFFFGDDVFGHQTFFTPGFRVYRRSPFAAFGNDSDENPHQRRRGGFAEIVRVFFPLIMISLFFFVTFRGFGTFNPQNLQEEQRLLSQQFALRKTSVHTIELKTSALEVPYYVRALPKTKSERRKLDDDVDRHYMHELNRECEYHKELKRRNMRNNEEKICSLSAEMKKKWARSPSSTLPKKKKDNTSPGKKKGTETENCPPECVQSKSCEEQKVSNENTAIPTKPSEEPKITPPENTESDKQKEL